MSLIQLSLLHIILDPITYKHTTGYQRRQFDSIDPVVRIIARILFVVP